jgi:two-component system cell cycle response regulator
MANERQTKDTRRVVPQRARHVWADPPVTLRVLVIEDSPEHMRLIQAILDEEGEEFAAEGAVRLSEGLGRLAGEAFDVVLLDLMLPDSSGIDTFARLRDEGPDVPVVVLTGVDDEGLAVEAVRLGAQDYLVKGRTENEGLRRAIRYAVERHRMQSELRQQALLDELTGLYNRRGFTILAEHQLRVAGRTKHPVAVLFVDLDGMKRINDSLGHAEGDRVLIDTAELLRTTLRASDLVARLGGDEFCALLPDCPSEVVDAVVRRLGDHLETHNQQAMRPFDLSISVGIALHDPASPASIQELIDRADRAMYEQKTGRAST